MEGMNCNECVRSNARLVARLAADLDTSSMRQLFQSIYPERACLPMATAFVQILIDEAPARRPMARATLSYQAAVA
jgi:hypothetical protein